jgi:hypothetical protein
MSFSCRGSIRVAIVSWRINAVAVLKFEVAASRFRQQFPELSLGLAEIERQRLGDFDGKKRARGGATVVSAKERHRHRTRQMDFSNMGWTLFAGQGGQLNSLSQVARFEFGLDMSQSK